MPDSRFRRALARQASDETGRRWIFVPYDQLCFEIGPLSRLEPEEAGIVLVECPAKAARRPYHKQKLALILANIRRFALEQAARGVAVRHLVARESYAATLAEVAAELGPLRCMRPAERELRAELAALVEDGALVYEEHEGFLAAPADLEAAHPKGPPWRMDRFYRQVRRRTGLLMAGGKPLGGKFSFDAENRKAWKGEPAAPELPRFAVDAITEEVGELIESRFADHPGRLDLGAVPTSSADHERLWSWFLAEALPSFGDFQDAMAIGETNLFHSRIAASLHLHRLLPRRVAADVVAAEAPLAAREGFLRQVLGWREFVRLVHEASDGFRAIPGRAPSPLDERGLALPNELEATEPLPAAFWGEPSGLACLDRSIADVWDEGYGHHIARLMVIANIATLIGVSPRELTDWFWCAYVDAFDWVVEPNVLGMGSYALGELMTTKPYVSGANYIDRMSDHCGSCRFHPKKSCPLTPLYWNFLDRNADRLAGNQRLSLPLRNLERRAGERRRLDAEIHRRVLRALRSGEEVPAEVTTEGR